jgi:pimeloyl-ACP methyl ester carboxylesterase
MNEEDVMIFRTHKGKQCIVAFGGLFHGLSEPVFEFKQFLNAHYPDCNTIFLRDREQLWYFNGINGFSSDVRTTARTLKKQIKRLNPSNVVFLGTSAGGYAALLYGLLLGNEYVDHILAFSPQTFLDATNRETLQDDSRKAHIKRLHRIIGKNHKYYDLIRVYANHLISAPKITIVTGRDDKTDVLHAARMQKYPEIKIAILEGGHKVVKTLRDSGQLNKLIDYVLQSE